MAAADQQSSARANSDDPAEQLVWLRLTAQHGDRLGQIMAEYGWPTTEMVGEEAARAAWLIAQHADRQLDVQRRALQLMQQAASAGAASRDLAFLQDRTHVNEGRKQTYGTQIEREGRGRQFRGPATSLNAWTNCGPKSASNPSTSTLPSSQLPDADRVRRGMP